MTKSIPTTMLLICLAGAAGIANNAPVAQQWRAEVMSSNDRASEEAALSDLLGVVGAARGENSWERAIHTAFVVPGPGLAGAGIARMTEDMTIMCRILDKATVWALRVSARDVAAGVQFGDSGSLLIADDRLSTQGLYLEGYGAIFFVPVDFPLVPPRQEPAPVPSEPPSDPLWSQTADELRGVPQQPSAPRPQYDAQKVEQVKASVIGVLRHASNLWTSGTQQRQDAIDVVIGGRLSQAERREWIYGAGRWNYGRGNPLQQQAGAGPDSAGEMPTVLILRTNRADVNALAKGDLTQQQFTEKVQVLKSWASAGSQAGSTSALGSRTSAPVQVTR